MNITEAQRILGVTGQDDERSVKLKFRKLMGQYHPDSIGSDLPEHTKRAQEINAAYLILKEHLQKHGFLARRMASQWNGMCNDHAYVERNIYTGYHMDETQMTYEEAQTAKNLHQTVARGKYYWDPDEEEFRFFLRSIHHAVLELLQAAERAVAANDFDEEELKEFRFPYQVRMFQYLAMQFIRPVECLKKLARPDREDSEGRKIYTFRAFLGEKGKTKVFDHISQLRQGDLLYPASLLNNRILVADRQGRELGYLSLEDDALYFCLIPLLKAHKAQVRMEVGAVEVNRRRRPMQVKANVTFQFRVDDREDFENTGLTEKISKMIDQYKQMLKEAV